MRPERANASAMALFMTAIFGTTISMSSLQRRSSVSASPCKCASFQSFSNWISSFLVSFVPVSASAWGNAKQQAQTKNNAKCPRVLIRMTLRHTRHALPIEPDLTDAFDAGENVIDSLTADSYQLCSDNSSNEIAWEIE